MIHMTSQVARALMSYSRSVNVKGRSGQPRPFADSVVRSNIFMVHRYSCP